jgi:predicted CxxxxCH...CXXCH cytochrome family protein
MSSFLSGQRKRLSVGVFLLISVAFSIYVYALTVTAPTVSPATVNTLTTFTAGGKTGNSGALAIGDSIIITLPQNFTVPATIAAGNVTVNTTACTVAPTVSGQTITVKTPVAIGVRTNFTVVIGSTTAVITNPSQPSTTAYTYDLSTTAETVLTSAAVTITASTGTQVSAATVTPNPTTASSAAQYTIAFNLGSAGRIATNAAGGANTIDIVFPAGTTVPGTIAAGNVTVNGTACTVAPTVSGQTVTITTPVNVASGGAVTVVFASAAGISNPATAGSYTINVDTSAETTARTSSSYTITAGADTTPPTVTGVTVQSGLTIDVTFSEAMGTGVTTATNYAISGAGQGTLATNPNSVALVSGNTYRLTWSAGEMVNGQTVTITVSNAKDVANNTIGSPNSGNGTGIGTAPTVSSTNPANSATGVTLNSNVTINFSENVNCSTVNTTNITSTSPGWTLSTCGTNQAVFTTSGQANSTSYTVTVGTSVTDSAGNPLAASYPFSYTTAAAAAVNSTTAGTATATKASTTSILVTMPYTDDANGTSRYTVDYKLSSTGSWTNWVTNATHVASPYTTTITPLTNSETYDVRVTYLDATDGVTGSAIQTISNISLAASTFVDRNLLHNSNRFPGTSKWMGTWGIPGGQYGAFTCSTCHSQSTSNIKRINSTITAPSGTFPGSTVNFKSILTNANSFGDDTNGHATSTRICEVCHSQTKYHNYFTTNNTGGLGHANNEDCMTCHPHNAGFKAGCDVCHGNPPTTSDNNGSTTTGLVWSPSPTRAVSPGAHQMHAVTMAMKCNTCHNGNTMPNVSNTIQMGFDISATNAPGWSGSKTGGSYNGFIPTAPYSFVSGDGNITTVTQTGSNKCSNLYCHGGWSGSGGSNTTPSWTSGASQAACGTCHGTTAASPPTAGDHAKHAGNGAGQLNLGCGMCHGPTPADNNHVDGRTVWMLSTGNALFGANAKYKGVSVSTTAVSLSSYGSCTNIYCHSDGTTATGGTVNIVPTWGVTSLPTNCTGCHNGSLIVATSSRMASGTHTPHIDNEGVAASFECKICHNVTVSGNTTISNYSNHTNAVVNVSFDATYGGSYSGTGVPGAANGNCTNVYCHSNGNINAATPTYKTVWWGSSWGAANHCAQCHGNGTNAWPTYTSGPGGSTIANSHVSHMTGGYSYTCNHCHAATAANNTTLVNGTTTHLNKVEDVVIWTTGVYNSTTKVCTNTFCHGSNSAAWGSNSTTIHVCTMCHGTPSASISGQGDPKIAPGGTGVDTNGDSAASDPQVGAHQSHLLSWNTYSSPVGCDDCHKVFANVTDAGHNDHALPAIIVWGTMSKMNGANPSYDAATRSCNNTYCHGAKMWYSSSNGRDTSPVWNSIGYLSGTKTAAGDCGMCHGAPPSGYTPNSHSGSEAIGDCNGCHPHVNTNGTFSDPTLHIDGKVDAAGGSCTGCHSNYQGANNYRRKVAGVEFSYNGTFTNMSSHMITTNAQSNSCLFCHEQSSHKSYTNGVSVKLQNTHVAGTIIFTTTAKSLTYFCNGCHRPQGYGGTIPSGAAGTATQPFLDSGNTKTPPAVAQWWSNASTYTGTSDGLPATTKNSHNGALDCMDCHGDMNGGSSWTTMPKINGHAGKTGNYLLFDTGNPVTTPGGTYSDQAVCLNSSTGCHGVNSTIPYTNARVYNTFYAFNTTTATGGAHPILKAVKPWATRIANDTAGAAFVNNWKSNSIATCQDCHGGQYGGGTRGPHGSTLAFMLKPVISTYPTSHSDGSNFTLTATPTSQTFCLNCHAADIYGTGDGGTGSNGGNRYGHGTAAPWNGTGNCGGPANNTTGVGCQNCHCGRGSGLTGTLKGTHQTNTARATGTIIAGFVNGNCWSAPPVAGTCNSYKTASGWNGCGKAPHQ